MIRQEGPRASNAMQWDKNTAPIIWFSGLLTIQTLTHPISPSTERKVAAVWIRLWGFEILAKAASTDAILVTWNPLLLKKLWGVTTMASPLLPCNCRDGRRGHPGGRPKLDCHIGPLVVFHAETLPPPPYYPTTASITAHNSTHVCIQAVQCLSSIQVLIHFAKSTIHSNFLLLEVTIILRHQKLVNYLSNLCQFWKTPDIPVLHIIGKVFIFKTSN